MADDAGAYYDANYYNVRGNNEALLSRVYYEMARALAECFQPRSVLEIGCGTGAVIHHLNRMDVQAQGIDGSEWAVENRLHPNVTQALADKLPFEDKQFDLIFSCHSLEHMQGGGLSGALSEISRVCSGAQVHLHPMIGTPPYTGDDFGHMVSLRQGDPTHITLRSRQWWLDRWASLGWSDAGVQIAYAHDNNGMEFSCCQYILGALSPETVQRIARWNFAIAADYQATLAGRTTAGHAHHVLRLRGE